MDKCKHENIILTGISGGTNEDNYSSGSFYIKCNCCKKEWGFSASSDEDEKSKYSDIKEFNKTFEIKLRKK